MAVPMAAERFTPRVSCRYQSARKVSRIGCRPIRVPLPLSRARRRVMQSRAVSSPCVVVMRRLRRQGVRLSRRWLRARAGPTAWAIHRFRTGLHRFSPTNTRERPLQEPFKRPAPRGGRRRSPHRRRCLPGHPLRSPVRPRSPVLRERRRLLRQHRRPQLRLVRRHREHHSLSVDRPRLTRWLR